MAKKLGKLLILSVLAAAAAGTYFYLKKQDKLEEDLAFNPDEEADPYDDSYEVEYSGDGDHSCMTMNTDPAPDANPASDVNPTSDTEPASGSEPASNAEKEEAEETSSKTTEASQAPSADSVDKSSETSVATPGVEEYFDDEK